MTGREKYVMKREKLRSQVVYRVRVLRVEGQVKVWSSEDLLKTYLIFVRLNTIVPTPAIY